MEVRKMSSRNAQDSILRNLANMELISEGALKRYCNIQIVLR